MNPPNASTPNPFLTLKARWVLADFVIISMLLGLGLMLLASLNLLPIQVGDPILAPLIYSLVFAGLCLVTVVRQRSPALNLRDVLGPLPRRSAWRQLLGLVAGLFLFSLGAFQVSYLVLSWVAPHQVESTLQQSLLLSADNTAAPRFYNGLMLFSVVVVAPVTEEFIFRGILLHRWAIKWGVRTAMILTSLLFGLLHANPIGLFMFGLVMALLYLTTRSLLVPMVAHALNNALAYGLEYTTRLSSAPSLYTLAELQSGWWLGGLCLLISAPWVLRYAVYHWPSATTPLPYFVNQSQRIRPSQPR